MGDDRKTASFEYTAEFHHIESALKSAWKDYTQLVAEMDAFSPRPLSDFEGDRERMHKQYAEINKDLPPEKLADFVNSQIAYHASPAAQFNQRFSEKFASICVVITMLSHALCEAVINAILAVGLAYENSEELFSLIEKAEIKEKWKIGPKCFSPEYSIDTGTAIWETLVHLTRYRNALVHYKVDLKVDGKQVLKGSEIKQMEYKDKVRWMYRYFSLPYDLHDIASRQLIKHGGHVLFDRSPIEGAKEHGTRKS